MSEDKLPAGPGRERLPVALIERFVENQSKEIELRQREMELEQQRENNGFSYGKAALEAQERDRKDERECRRNQRKDQQRMMLYLAGLIVIVVLGALWLGSEALAMELAKAILLLSAGAAGGYGVGRSKRGVPDDAGE